MSPCGSMTDKVSPCEDRPQIRGLKRNQICSRAKCSDETDKKKSNSSHTINERWPIEASKVEVKEPILVSRGSEELQSKHTIKVISTKQRDDTVINTFCNIRKTDAKTIYVDSIQRIKIRSKLKPSKIIFRNSIEKDEKKDAQHYKRSRKRRVASQRKPVLLDMSSESTHHSLTSTVPLDTDTEKEPCHLTEGQGVNEGHTDRFGAEQSSEYHSKKQINEHSTFTNIKQKQVPKVKLKYKTYECNSIINSNVIDDHLNLTGGKAPATFNPDERPTLIRSTPINTSNREHNSSMSSVNDQDTSYQAVEEISLDNITVRPNKLIKLRGEMKMVEEELAITRKDDNLHKQLKKRLKEHRIDIAIAEGLIKLKGLIMEKERLEYYIGKVQRYLHLPYVTEEENDYLLEKVNMTLNDRVAGNSESFVNAVLTHSVPQADVITNQSLISATEVAEIKQ